MQIFDYTIKDELGIHAKPVGLLVKEAGGCNFSIKIAKGEKSADAKKIFGIMGLGAKCGDTITITIDGEDEEEAATRLEEFMKTIW